MILSYREGGGLGAGHHTSKKAMFVLMPLNQTISIFNKKILCKVSDFFCLFKSLILNLTSKFIEGLNFSFRIVFAYIFYVRIRWNWWLLLKTARFLELWNAVTLVSAAGGIPKSYNLMGKFLYFTKNITLQYRIVAQCALIVFGSKIQPGHA